MNVVIIEDETLASEHMEGMIREYDRDVQILAVLESVEDSVEWFRSHRHPDLVFLDIQLEDDLSFAIFEQVEIKCPVIFTTAYDEYAIRAFKLRSIDYLLKPIEQEALNEAIMKYREMIHPAPGRQDLLELIQQINPGKRSFRERFSVKVGQKIKTFRTGDVAWFTSESGITTARLNNSKDYVVDLSLGQLEEELDPSEFFRINRKMLVSLPSIKEVHILSNSRLKLDLEPAPDQDPLVSIDRVTGFKKWLDGAR